MPSLQERANELAAGQQPCPRCHANCPNDSAVCAECEDCHGTGRVPLFEGVRDQCRCFDPQRICDACRAKGYMHGPHCERCAGRGWTATLSLERWLVAVIATRDAELIDALHNWFHGLLFVDATKPLEALFSALEQAQHD